VTDAATRRFAQNFLRCDEAGEAAEPRAPAARPTPSLCRSRADAASTLRDSSESDFGLALTRHRE
jgi:hypothetical protein